MAQPPPACAQRHLRPFAAIEQDQAPPGAHERRGEIAVGQRLHPGRAEQADIEH